MYNSKDQANELFMETDPASNSYFGDPYQPGCQLQAVTDQADHRFMELDPARNSYFGNPFQLGYEQYGLEHLDRHGKDAGEIESVAILGYN